MKRWIVFPVLVSVWMLNSFASSTLATPVDDPVPSVPDPGELTNEPASPGRINCWVARTGRRAVSVSIYEDGGKKMAKLRLYTKPATEPEEYSGVNTVIPIPGSATPDDVRVVPVELVEVASRPNTFEMKYEKRVDTTITVVNLGFLTFSPSVNGRASSDVIVRFKGEVKAANTAVFGTSTSTNPCDEPPDDDIGEEEEIPPGFTPVGEQPTAPGSSLPLTAPVATVAVPVVP